MSFDRRNRYRAVQTKDLYSDRQRYSLEFKRWFHLKWRKLYVTGTIKELTDAASRHATPFSARVVDLGRFPRAADPTSQPEKAA